MLNVRFVFFLVLFFCPFLTLNSYASCKYINGNSSGSSSIAFGNITVQRDIPNGTVIKKINDTGLSSKPNFIECDATLRDMKYGGTSNSTFTYEGITYFNIGVEGFGVRITSNSGAWKAIWNGGSLPILLVNDGFCNKGTDYIQYCGGSWGTGGLNFELVKVSNETSSGSIMPSGVLIKASVEDEIDAFTWSLAAGNITVLKCQISTPSLTFEMGNMDVGIFTGGIGSTPAQTERTQSLGLNCDDDANITVTMSGVQNDDTSVPSVLALTSQGSTGIAQGIGVQLLYNNTPLELNKNLILKKSAGGQETFPITARYYQTKTTVMPGKADASATLNLTYQ